MENSIISAKGIKKSFKTNSILESVDIEVKKGEIYALLGANGAGKTTFIKILSTLLKPDSGEAEICGFNISKEPEKVRESISLTGQFAAVDEILTGRENLKLISGLKDIKMSNEDLDNVMKRFGLTDAADRRAGTYSGGMLRKLDIAMSLIGSPKVIFLDEPTTGLDPEARIEVWRNIKELARGGTTIFLTTQYLEEAEHLSDRIAILNDGYIIAEGTLDELKRLFPAPKVEYVEKQPSLEEIFLSIVKNTEKKGVSRNDTPGEVN